MGQAIILIPARYKSSRFPGKPLAMIKGQSMIQRVYENMASTGHDTYVVTDNQEIEDHVKSFGKVIRVDDEVETGSERIYLGYKNLGEKYEYVINVQGDEPLLKKTDIEHLLGFHQTTNFDVATLVKKRSTGEADFQNPNIVKALFVPSSGQCLYFSRASIPFDRDQKGSHWYQHIGVYCYRSQALEQFHSLPLGQYENIEKLEQLRLLENQKTIGAVLSESKLVGVDHPEDVAKVEELLNE